MNKLLASTFIFFGLTLNYQNLHASSMQQKAVQATLKQKVSQATAEELIKHKEEMTKFEKNFKDKVSANDYVTKKHAGKSDEDILKGK